jgi:IS605 OrfB family transposase
MSNDIQQNFDRKQNQKKKKEEKKAYLSFLKGQVLKHKNQFKLPTNLNFNEIETHSWFNLKKSNEPQLFEDIKNIEFESLESDGYKTRQIKLNLLDSQKKVIDKWFDMYILMYNTTVGYIKKCVYNHIHVPYLSEIKKELFNKKKEIQRNSIMSIMVDGKLKKVCVNSHMLDYAINDSLNAYQSCMTNLQRKNIRYFRLRYLKLTKPNKIIKLEKSAFTQHGFCPSSMGQFVNCSINNFNYVANINTVAIITKRKNEYYLLLKYPINNYENNSTETISIDFGIRVLGTGYTNNGIIEIGSNVAAEIKKRLKQIDRISKKFKKNNGDDYDEEIDQFDPEKVEAKRLFDLAQKEKEKNNKKNDDLNQTVYKKGRKIIRKKYEKLKNRVTDMHWKIAKYLTDHYKNIIVGNFSTKSMGEQNTMQKMIKRIGNMMSFYKLKQKIKYLCLKNKTNYKETNEKYTTKCCSNCCWYNANIGGKKIYNCNKCEMVIDRDINSSRMILFVDMN